MRKRLLTLLAAVLAAFAICGGLLWGVLTFGNVSVPVGGREALKELEREGEFAYFDAAAIQNVSGTRYYYGFRQPTLAVRFSAPRSALSLEGAEMDANEHLKSSFDTYGAPTGEDLDYYSLGCDRDYRDTGAHPHRYCAVTQPDGDGLVHVYYVREGAEW